jgi:hypothetical protein
MKRNDIDSLVEGPGKASLCVRVKLDVPITPTFSHLSMSLRITGLNVSVVKLDVPIQYYPLTNVISLDLTIGAVY